MQPREVVVQAPARLHFGLFSFGNVGRQYGGVGVMVEQPFVKIVLDEASQFTATGMHADCVRRAASQWSEAVERPGLPCCQVRVLAAPRRHVGLGSGTQIALAVAAGLTAWHELPEPTPIQLAQMAGRGHRSAVGTYGFRHGGLIVESGKLTDDRLAPLEQRQEFPRDWRIVLVRWERASGLHGTGEQVAFDKLPPVTPEVRDALREEVAQRMLPALAAGDFPAFAESVYQFGYRAGCCFAPVQGGPYNGKQVTQTVEYIRSLGVAGVGQSSWGPTVFCVLPSHQAANQLVDDLQGHFGCHDLDFSVTAADNQGARIGVG